MLTDLFLKRTGPNARRLVCEALESRTMLSGQTLAGLPAVAQQSIMSLIGKEVKLTGAHIASEGLGSSVAISGNTMVVGSPCIGAYVFTESGSLWTQVAKLTYSDPWNYNNFACAVAISGDTVVVGAPSTSAPDTKGCQGAACVYTKPATGWADMTETAKLTVSDGAGSEMGTVVAISGNTVVVGGADVDEYVSTRSGAAYVFTEPPTGWVNMTQTAKLTPSYRNRLLDQFGSLPGSISISGNTVAIGDYVSHRPWGSVYLFTEPASGWADMTQTADIMSPEWKSVMDGFGGSVSISGNTLVVGAPSAAVGNNDGQGAAYVFTEPASGWADVPQPFGQSMPFVKITAPDGAAHDHFGHSVSISGESVLVGTNASVLDQNGDYPAAVYVFTESGSDWTQAAKTTGSAGKDGFGRLIAISGNSIVVGAPYTTVGDQMGQGAVHMFELTPTPPAPTPPDPTPAPTPPAPPPAPTPPAPTPPALTPAATHATTLAITLASRSASTSKSASVPAPKIISTAPKSATVGQTYTYQVKTNSQTTFAFRAAPAGMTLNRATGLVTWRPTAFQAGSYAVTLLAMNGASETIQTYEISVTDRDNPFASTRRTLAGPSRLF